MFVRRRHSSSSGDAGWPGFVDALSSLLLVIIFLLSMFVLAQFFLGKALSGRDEALAELRTQVSELGGLLRLERQSNQDLRSQVGQLSASLQSATAINDTLKNQVALLTETVRDRETSLADISQKYAASSEALKDVQARYGLAETALNNERALSARARDEVNKLQQDITTLKEQLARLEVALDASDKRDKEQQAVIVNLGQRLNRALAAKVEELASYRSEFFGKLREVLSNRPEIRIEGDRFVFASELLFASGSATLGAEGRAELRKLAETLLTLSRDIPPDVKWILRVDGHTDAVPISNANFRNNWELSAGRAIAVVEFLIIAGVPANRLAAAGFGQHQPLDNRTTAEAYARNRRIEMRLTDR